MTNQNNAAQAADTNPLSDEYVNAVIQQHGYDSPECVIARLHQWIGLHGRENGVTLLMYEAHKALSKLRAPAADEPVAWMWRRRQVDKWICVGHWDSIEAAAAVQMEKDGWDVVRLCPALASAPVVGEAVAWEIPNPHLGSELTSHKARADEARRLGLTVHELFRHAAPQASAEHLVRYCPGCGSIGPVEEKYRDCCPDGDEARMIPAALAEKCRDTFNIAVKAMLADAAANDSTAPQASEAMRDALWTLTEHNALHFGEQHNTVIPGRAALSAQPADKPATARAAPAPMPRQQCVCRLPETGNAHTDGGAVYE